jgi:hypothetical protein
MLGDLIIRRRIERDFSAGERDEGELMLGEQILQFRRLELRHGVSTELNAGKPCGCYVVDGLPLILAPRHGGVTEANLARARCAERG